MRTRVNCNCGWRRELSSFYQGKRIRCPECRTILNVPGESARMYESPGIEQWLHRPSRRPGRWVYVHEMRPRRRCGLMCVVPHVLMAGVIALVLVAIVGLDGCDRDMGKAGKALEDPAPMDEPMPEAAPQLPEEALEPKAAPEKKPQASPASEEDELDSEFEDEF